MIDTFPKANIGSALWDPWSMETICYWKKIRPTLGRSDGHGILPPWVHADDNVVHLYSIHRGARLFLFMLRHRRQRRQNRTSHPQAPAVNAHGYSVSRSIVHVNTFFFLVSSRSKTRIFFQYVSRFSPVNSVLLTSDPDSSPS
jgi:hypothetical protein